MTYVDQYAVVTTVLLEIGCLASHLDTDHQTISAYIDYLIGIDLRYSVLQILPNVMRVLNEILLLHHVDRC